jgi:uncharacterized protein
MRVNGWTANGEGRRGVGHFFCRARRHVDPTFRSVHPVEIAAVLLVAASFLSGCHSAGDNGEVEVHVRGVMIDAASHSPVVVLEDRAGGAELPIWVGPAEARAIVMRLEGVEAPRPMTHDLMKNMLDQTGVRFDRVSIHALDEGTYYARIFLTAEGDSVEIDSRPSDAIALAVRFDKPIFVARDLLERPASVVSGPRGADVLTVEGVTVQALSEELAEHFAIRPGGGVLVSAVADQTGGGLHPGDVVLEVEGKAVRSPAEFASMVHDASGKLDLFVQRHGTQVHIAFAPMDH